MIRKYPKYITTYDKKLSLTLRIFLLLDNNKHLTYVVVLEDTAGYLTPLWCQIHVLDNFHMFILEQPLLHNKLIVNHLLLKGKYD